MVLRSLMQPDRPGALSNRHRRRALAACAAVIATVMASRDVTA